MRRVAPRRPHVFGSCGPAVAPCAAGGQYRPLSILAAFDLAAAVGQYTRRRAVSPDNDDEDGLIVKIKTF